VGPKLLIVDDHPGFRAEAGALLRGESYEVVGEAEDGESGVAAARSLRPEVVLVDIQLPDIDGFEVARRILGAPGAPAVILISSRDAADYGARISGCGAAGFIFKGDLGRSAIDSLLDRTR
jgi:DNA-binding NarL/FixJ family response regulator